MKMATDIDEDWCEEQHSVSVLSNVMGALNYRSTGRVDRVIFCIRKSGKEAFTHNTRYHCLWWLWERISLSFCWFEHPFSYEPNLGPGGVVPPCLPNTIASRRTIDSRDVGGGLIM